MNAIVDPTWWDNVKSTIAAIPLNIMEIAEKIRYSRVEVLWLNIAPYIKKAPLITAKIAGEYRIYQSS